MQSWAMPGSLGSTIKHLMYRAQRHGGAGSCPRLYARSMEELRQLPALAPARRPLLCQPSWRQAHPPTILHSLKTQPCGDGFPGCCTTVASAGPAAGPQAGEGSDAGRAHCSVAPTFLHRPPTRRLALPATRLGRGEGGEPPRPPALAPGHPADSSALAQRSHGLHAASLLCAVQAGRLAEKTGPVCPSQEKGRCRVPSPSPAIGPGRGRCTTGPGARGESPSSWCRLSRPLSTGDQEPGEFRLAFVLRR